MSHREERIELYRALEVAEVTARVEHTSGPTGLGSSSYYG